MYSTRDQRVYRAAADGSGTQALVVSENNEANDPDWSPDGQWIVYDFGPPGTIEATAEGRYPSDVYVIRADGHADVRLTHVGACCANWHAAA